MPSCPLPSGLPWDGETGFKKQEAADPGCARPGPRTWVLQAPHALSEDPRVPPFPKLESLIGRLQTQGNQVVFQRPGLQAGSRCSSGFYGIITSFVVPGLVAGVTRSSEATGLCILAPPAWSSPMGPIGR